MSGQVCGVCGKIRKVDIISVPGGWNQPPCYNCGDPGYFEPDNDRGRYERVYASIEKLEGEDYPYPHYRYEIRLELGDKLHVSRQVLSLFDQDQLEQDKGGFAHLWTEMVWALDEHLKKEGLD